MKTPKRIHSIAREAYDLITFFVFVLGVMLFVRFFILNPFTVIGSSMSNTIHEGDVLIINKRDNYTKNYKKGDIIVFVPQGKTDAFIKRIVGVPGETVNIKDGKVEVCKTGTAACHILQENYLDIGTKTESGPGCKSTFVVEEGFLVFGDNRGGSSDSRCCFGASCSDESTFTVSQEDIIGKASLRILPFNKITTF